MLPTHLAQTRTAPPSPLAARGAPAVTRTRRGLCQGAALAAVLVGATGCGAPRDPVERAAEFSRVEAAILTDLPMATGVEVSSWMNGFAESVRIDLALEADKPLSVRHLETLHAAVCEEISWGAPDMWVSAYPKGEPLGEVDLTSAISPTEQEAGAFRITRAPGTGVHLPGCP